MARLRIWQRPRLLLNIAALGVVIFHVIAFGLWAPGGDARIFYDADLTALYQGNIFTETYNYSPAFAWWIQPLQALPFEVFRTLIVAVDMAGFVYLIGPGFAAVVLLSQLLPVWMEFQLANLNFAVGALLVIAFRHPALYAFPLLTKVTPGVGLVWFAVRREWRALVVVAAVTIALALPVGILHFGTWPEWVGSLATNAGVDAQIGAPVILRVALAGGVVAWGGLTGRRWTVPIAAALAAHVNGGGWLIAVAVVPLIREQLREHGDERAPVR